MNKLTLGILLQASSDSSIIEAPAILTLVIIVMMGITIFYKRKTTTMKELSINNPKQETSNSNSVLVFFVTVNLILLIFIGFYIFPKGEKAKAETFANSYIRGFLGNNEYYLSETIKCWDGSFCCRIDKNSSNVNNNSSFSPDGYQLRIGYDGAIAGGYYLISIIPFTNDYNSIQKGKNGFYYGDLTWPEKDNFLNK